MKRIELSALPTRAGLHDRWLYACEFDDGSVKVGISGAPQWRLGLVYDEARRERGAVMVGVFGVLITNDAPRYTAETEMVKSLAQRAGITRVGRETFFGLPYAVAMDAVRHFATDVALGQKLAA